MLTCPGFINNLLVMNSDTLNHVFSALADPTRRGMLSQLAEGQSNVRSLAEHYRISQPAISKHLRVLERAGLITKAKKGRESIVKANPQPMEDAASWIGVYARYWHAHFDAVEDYLETTGKTFAKEHDL